MHRRLLEQAWQLARHEPRRPRQASLRRSVSAAYYALFHFLIDRACRSIVGGSPARKRLRLILARAFVHGHMHAASRSVAGGNLPLAFGWSTPIPPVLREIAHAFRKLQDERHRADYDLSRPFARGEVLGLVQIAANAVTNWPAIADDNTARLYLILLLTWKNLEQR